MANYEEEVIESKLTDHLIDLGFSEYEAHTLVALMRLGTGTAKDVADIDHVPRTRVYDAVEVLHERGLVDIQHTTPKKFTVISTESIVRKLNAERESTLNTVAELSEQLTPAEPPTEQMGVWTVTGGPTVSQRVMEFMDEADEEIIYMTVDDLLTDDHLDHLREADERGVDIYLAGISEPVQERIRNVVPSAMLFETLWEWADSPAGSLLITDQDTALVSVRTNREGPDPLDETAIWGSGETNSLVVVLRAIFSWRLHDNEFTSDGASS